MYDDSESQTIQVTLPLGKKELFNSRALVAFWFKKKKIGLAELRKGLSELLCTLRLDYAEWLRTYKYIHSNTKVIGLSALEIEDGFYEYCKAFEQDCREKALLAFKCSNENLSPLSNFLIAVTGEAGNLDMAILAHWLWQVKRRAFGMSSDYALMPIFVGAQGGGKSKALNLLLEPFKEFRVNLKMSQLSDERMYEAFSKNYVALFDELQGIERVDLNALKNQVTTEVNTFRRLHTTDVVTVPMRCSFLGASNKPIKENFSDSTGMRRFYELKVLPVLNWEAINALDYMDIWLGINESKPMGYMTSEILASLKEVQAELITAEDVELFVRELGIVPESDEYALTAGEELYRTYQLWAADSGIRYPGPRKHFYTRLEGCGLGKVQQKNKHGNSRVFFKTNPKSEFAKIGVPVSKTVLEFKKGE